MCGQKEVSLPHLCRYKWPEVKSKCASIGINLKQEIPCPKQRNIFYRTIALTKSVQELRQFFETEQHKVAFAS